MLSTEQLVLKKQSKPMLVKDLNKTLKNLGYRLDRSEDCKGISRVYPFNPDEEEYSYLCCTTGIKEIDSGMSAFHYQAKRDANFKQLQAMRLSGEYFAVLKNGYILEI
jgi:hypothetical protein